MSDDEQNPRTADDAAAGSAAGRTGGATGATPGGPRPEEIRFFGTTWVDHGGHYGLRRAGLAAGAFAAAVASCFVLRFAFQGLRIANTGGLVNGLVIVMFAVCSAIACRKTWEGFQRRPDDPAREDALRSLKAIGFIGSLLAYGARCLTEAPGEKLHRAEYEAALARYEKRRGSRTGNPAARKKPRRGR